MNRRRMDRRRGLVLVGVGVAVVLAAVGASLRQPHPDWVPCPAAYDVKKYDAADTWALIVNQGREGFVFGYYSFENSPPGLSGERLSEFVGFREALRASGTQLIVVVIPGKGLIEDDKVNWRTLRARKADLGFLHSRYQEYVQSFRQVGVYAVDVLQVARNAPPGQALYFKLDHHWTPTLSGLVAKDIARHVRTTRAYAETPPRPFVLEQRDEENRGSYAEILSKLCGLDLPPEKYASQVAREVGGNTDLLGDTEPQIALVGDSHSIEPSFSASLRSELQRDVANHSVRGGGAKGAMETYMLSGDFKQAPPRFLIWEFDTGLTTPGFLAQMTAAAQGPCAGSRQAFFTSRKVETAAPRVVLPATLNTRPGDYLHLHLADLSIRKFSLGSTTTQLHDKSRNSGHFFVPLPVGTSGPLRLVLPSIPRGPVSLSVCHAP